MVPWNCWGRRERREGKMRTGPTRKKELGEEVFAEEA